MDFHPHQDTPDTHTTHTQQVPAVLTTILAGYRIARDVADSSMALSVQLTICATSDQAKGLHLPLPP